MRIFWLITVLVLAGFSGYFFYARNTAEATQQQ